MVNQGNNQTNQTNTDQKKIQKVNTSLGIIILTAFLVILSEVFVPDNPINSFLEARTRNPVWMMVILAVFVSSGLIFLARVLNLKLVIFSVEFGGEGINPNIDNIVLWSTIGISVLIFCMLYFLSVKSPPYCDQPPSLSYKKSETGTGSPTIIFPNSTIEMEPGSLVEINVVPTGKSVALEHFLLCDWSYSVGDQTQKGETCKVRFYASNSGSIGGLVVGTRLSPCRSGPLENFQIKVK